MAPVRAHGHACDDRRSLALAAMPTQAADPPSTDTGVSMDLDVIARRLDVARQQIQPSLGASVYNFSPQALETIPQGENAPLNQVLLQAPGRRAGQFRPDPSARRARQRAVPPERRRTARGTVGFRPGARFALRQQHIADHRRAAGAVRLPDRGRGRYPDQDRHHQSRLCGCRCMADSRNWLQPSFEYGGRAGPVDWFITGDFLHNDRRHRESDLQLQRDPRHHEPVPRPRLCLRHHRSRIRGSA